MVGWGFMRNGASLLLASDTDQSHALVLLPDGGRPPNQLRVDGSHPDTSFLGSDGQEVGAFYLSRHTCRKRTVNTAAIPPRR